MIQRNRNASFAAFVCALLFSGAALAQAPAPAPAQAAAPLAKQDAQFLQQAAQNGHAEVESSKLAQTKATTPQVKAFAEQMVADHTKTGEELKTLAQSKGVQVPAEPSDKQKSKLQKLGSAEGAKFDKQYASEMGVDAHEDTVKLFKKGASQAKDPDVKAFAERTLPTLEHHLSMAKELKSTVDKSTK